MFNPVLTTWRVSPPGSNARGETRKNSTKWRLATFFDSLILLMYLKDLLFIEWTMRKGGSSRMHIPKAHLIEKNKHVLNESKGQNRTIIMLRS